MAKDGEKGERKPTPRREVVTDHGRVYQPEGYGRSALDWTPPGPIEGHRTLTRGVITEHPAAGPIVRFAEKCGSRAICVRITPDRGTLAELVALAGSMDSEIRAEAEAGRARREAERGARIAADVATFAATLPAGYVAIEDVDHDPSAADGWGMTSFRHAGVDLTSHEVHGLDPRYHHPLGEPGLLAAYVPADALASLVARKRAEATAKEGARAARVAAGEADRAAKIDRARATGSPVELARWTEGCDGSVDECSVDICVRSAQPDGTVTVRRIHAH